VGHHLQSIVMSLPPGSQRAVHAALSYGDEDAAALAELAVRQALGAVDRSAQPNGALAWLATATVDRADKRVVMSAPLPHNLLDVLARAGGAPARP
jgi:hypothetical protein